MDSRVEANRKGRVEGKIALVTGAARGIGSAIAQRLASEGATLYVTDLLTAQVEDTAALIRRGGGSATAISHDATRPEDWESVVGRIGKEAGRLDILVNNAGRCVIAPLEEASLEHWREVLAVNLDSVFLGVRYCLPLLRASGSASVVNLASTGGIVAVPGCAAYTAAKGGIRAFSKTAAIELAQRGYRIRVNSVHPGPTDTERAVGLMGQAYGMAPDVVRTECGKALPLGRLGAPDDVAAAVLYLASDEASWVTGSELIVDGGDTAR